jgi:two-component system, OmpR family, response regulator
MGAPTAGVCEDHHELRGVLRDALERDGFTVRATSSGSEAIEAFAAAPPDVLILDIGLPDADGRDVCQALRANGVSAPVLFLTARDALTDRVSGFHAGGDDYLVKPFALAELLVRVRALVRRGGGAGGDEIADGGIVLDPTAHALSVGERQTRLTPTEFRLLAALAAQRGKVLRRGELISAAWPLGAIVHDNTLDAYAARLRRKLRALGAPDALETVRGVGYVLR